MFVTYELKSCKYIIIISYFQLYWWSSRRDPSVITSHLLPMDGISLKLTMIDHDWPWLTMNDHYRKNGRHTTDRWPSVDITKHYINLQINKKLKYEIWILYNYIWSVNVSSILVFISLLIRHVIVIHYPCVYFTPYKTRNSHTLSWCLFHSL